MFTGLPGRREWGRSGRSQNQPDQFAVTVDSGSGWFVRHGLGAVGIGEEVINRILIDLSSGMEWKEGRDQAQKEIRQKALEHHRERAPKTVMFWLFYIDTERSRDH